MIAVAAVSALGWSRDIAAAMENTMKGDFRTIARVCAVLVALVCTVARPAAAQRVTINVKSGNGAPGTADAWTWVAGGEVPGIPSSGLPLEHLVVVNTPPSWEDIGGGARWVAPAADTLGAPGGYWYIAD